MENFTWDAVPSQRQQKVEKYNYPVMTMVALSKPGAGRKFSFNKASQELLDIKGEGRVSFGFNTEAKIVAVRKAEGEAGLRLTKTCTISDKRTYEFMSKLLELSNDVENEFKVVDGEGYFKLELLDSNTETTETTETVEETESATEYYNSEETAAADKVEEELAVTPSEDVNNQW